MAINTTVEVVMPAMGDSVSEGTILEWHKQEGDTVSEDEVLVEISTDKVDAELPAPPSGTVEKIDAAEGATVSVGSVLAEIATNGAQAAPSEPSASDAPAADGAPPSEAATPDTPAADGAPPSEAATPDAPERAPSGQTVDVVMPAMGESVSEGVILEWSKQPGDAVQADETIVEISTDKVDAEVPAPVSGTVAEILAEAGDTVNVGQVIARVAAGDGAATSAVAPKPEPTAAPRPAAQEPTVETPDGLKVSPVAKRVAVALGVDLGSIDGSGPGGRISKSDVLAAADGGNRATAAAANPAAAAEGATLIKGASAMLARYMDESRSIPTATSFRTLTVTTLDARRRQLKDSGHKVSFTHLI